MDDQQLIQLVRETLPEDLSEQQVVALRQAMRTRPLVREALLEELHVGEAIATRLAPEMAGAEELVMRLQQLDTQRKRSRRVWLLLGLLVAGAGLALLWQAPPHVRRFVDSNLIVVADITKDDSRVRQPKTDAHPREDVPAVPAPDEPPTVAVVDPGGASAPTAENTLGGPAKHDAPDAPAVATADQPPKRDPPWRLFDDPAARGEPRWMAAAQQLLTPLGGAQLDPDEQQNQIRLNGKFKLIPPTADGRIVRLRMSNPQRMQLSLQAGDRHARIEWADGQILRGYVGHREQKPAETMLPDGIDVRFRRTHIVQQIDESINFTWPKGPVVAGQPIGPSNFAVRWTGKIVVPRYGRYRFFTTSDDGIALYVDGRRIIHNWSDHSATQNHGDIVLAAGAHELVLEYYQGEGDAVAILDWQGPKLRRQRVPADVLRPPDDYDAAAGQRGLLGTYCFGPPETEEAIPWKLVTDDGWRWRFFRSGAIDLRYQDGHVILARGDVVLLALPLEQPPSYVTLDTQCVLRLAEVLHLEPLSVSEASLQSGRGYATSAAEDMGPQSAGDVASQPRPSDLTWTIDPEVPATEFELAKQSDGSVVVQRDERSQAEVWALTTVEVGSGVEVLMQLTGATTGSGFALEAYNGRHYFVVAKRPDGNVLCNNPFDSAHVDHYRRTAGTLGDRFFCRIVYGLGHVRVEVSEDGQQWRYLWHHDVEQRGPVPETVRVGLLLRGGEGPRRVQLERLAIRRPKALESLVDAALVQKARAAMADVADRRHNWTKALEAARDKAPAGVTPELWRLACLTAALREAAVPIVRRGVAMEILDEAIAQNIPFSRVLAALQELPTRALIARGNDPFCKWSTVQHLYDRLGAREQDAGRSKNLAVLLDTWYGQDYGLGIRGDVPEFVAPYELVRLQLYDLRARQDSEALRQAALRYLFMERSGEGTAPAGAQKTNAPQVAEWMLHEVNQYLPETRRMVWPSDKRVVKAAAQLRHPLVAESDREATNTISEFLTAVNDKQYAYAARMLTQRSLPDGIVPLDANGDLSKATFVLLREQIEAHPPLRDVLQRDYDALGRLRLRQHLDHGQYDQLESLATQFHGTTAAREALVMLADRDLAVGNFFSAAALYDQIRRQTSGEISTETAAKRRLALAMTGQLAGEPVRDQVRFSGQTMSAGEFEAMIKKLVAERSIVAKKAGNTPGGPRPAPPPRNMQVAGDIKIWLEPHAKHKRQDVAWSVGDKFLAVQTYSRLYMIELAGKRLLWHKDHQRRGDKALAAVPHTPLMVDDKVIGGYHRGGKTGLACFNAQDGKEIWQQPLDDALVSDPLLIGSWIYVFSAQRDDLEGYVNIVLRRLSPETGESLLAKRVIRLRLGESPLYAGRPALVGDALLLRITGGLVCCDLMGETRWIRRLAYVPYGIDNRLYETRLTSPIAIDENRVIMASAGSPSLVCIDAVTGEEVWKRAAPDVLHVVGPIAGKIVYTCPQRLVAVDAKTGHHAWQRDTMAAGQSVLAAAGDTLLTVTLDPQQKQGRRRGDLSLRRIEWLAAADGRSVKQVDLPQRQNEVFDAGPLVTDGKLIFGVASFIRNSRDARLFWIEPK